VQAFRDTLEDLRREGSTTVFLSSHVLGEVESTCERIGLVRAGRMVATETIESLKQKAPRTVSVDFVDATREPPAMPGIVVRQRTDRRWVLEISGALGPLIQALSSTPVHDLQIEPFRLEDYIARLYGVEVRQKQQ